MQKVVHLGLAMFGAKEFVKQCMPLLLEQGRRVAVAFTPYWKIKWEEEGYAETEDLEEVRIFIEVASPYWDFDPDALCIVVGPVSDDVGTSLFPDVFHFGGYMERRPHFGTEELTEEEKIRLAELPQEAVFALLPKLIRSFDMPVYVTN